MYPCIPQFYYIKLGFRGVFIARTCFPDAEENGNKTRMDDTGSETQEFISKVNGKLATLQGQNKEIENMVISVGNGLKQEKAWQREAISNVTKYCNDIQSSVTKKSRNLQQTVHDMRENNAENEQKLSNIETENRELRIMIAEIQTDTKKMQGDIEKIQAENKAMKDIIRELKKDNENVKPELAQMESKLFITKTFRDMYTPSNPTLI